MDNDQGTAPKPYDGRYLFINSSSESPSRNRDDSFNIASHVSKNHRKWLKHERLKRLTTTNGKPVSQRQILPATIILPQSASPWRMTSPDEAQTASATIDSNQVQDNEQVSRVKHQARYNSASQSASAELPLNNENSQPVYRFQDSQDKGDQQRKLASSAGKDQTAAVTQPSLSPWKGNADPFSAAAMPIDPHDFEMIRQAQRFLVFAAWPDKASAVFRTPIADTSNSLVQLQQVISDEAEIHAILASGYQVAADSSVKEDAAGLAARSLAHKMRAIALLRDRLLRRGFSESVATLIRLLISLDFHAGEHGAALVHLRGLWSMAASAPGVLIDAQELLIVSDVWIGLSLLKKPEIPPSQYDPGERYMQTFDIALRVLEAEHRGTAPVDQPLLLHAYATFDSKTWMLLDSACEIVNTKDIMDKITDPELQREVVWWMHRRATAVSGSLTVAYVNAREAARSPKLDRHAELGRTLAAAACLSAILYMNFRFVDSPSNYNFSRSFQSIEPLLRRASNIYSKDPLSHKKHDEAYLWLLFLCAMGNDLFAARGDIPYSPWPVAEFHRVYGRLNFPTENEATDLLRQFPYFRQMDAFVTELLLRQDTAPTTHLVSWPKWCVILDHYNS